MRPVRSLTLAFALALLGACRSTTEPTVQPLSITTDDVGVTLRNPNPWPVFYRVQNLEALMALISVPFGPDDPRVAPGATVRVPYGAAAGYVPGVRNLAVMEWSLRRNRDGTYSPVSMRQTNITVPRTT